MKKAATERAEILHANGKEYDWKELLRLEPTPGLPMSARPRSRTGNNGWGPKYRCLVPMTSFSEPDQVGGSRVEFTLTRDVRSAPAFRRSGQTDARRKALPKPAHTGHLRLMRDLLTLGQRAGDLLQGRGEKIAVGETSAGGLITASLLAVPGASTYFAGGAVPYSARSIRGLAGISTDRMRDNGIRSSSEPYALLLATEIRARHGRIAWGLAETGAAGPSGNSYGDPAGHTCLAVVGAVTIARTLRTGSEDRVANMWAFAEAALQLLIEALESAPRAVQ